MTSKRIPSAVELEKDEFIVESISGYHLEKSVTKQVMLKGVVDIGFWYITNRRIIYEGKKRTVASYIFGFFVGREKDIVVIPHDKVISVEIIPYGPMDKAIDVKYQDEGNIKSEYIGLPVIARRRLNELKDFIEKAKDITSFCGNCGYPLTQEEKFCPKCGAKRE